MAAAQHDPRHREAGSASAEVVLVVPALMLLILLAVQFGLWYHASSVARAAAQDAAQSVRVDGGTTAAGEVEARSFLAQSASTLVGDVEVNVTSNGDTARVEVRGVAVSVIPGWHLPVHAVSSGPIERFRSPAEQDEGP